MTNPLDHAAEIAGWLAATSIDKLELTGPAGRLVLRREGARAVEEAAAAQPLWPASTSPSAGIVSSPGLGHLLHAHPLFATPLVAVGARVIKGQVLGLLRVGAVLQPVRSHRDGVVARPVAPDGGLVGYGDALFELAPAA